MNRPVPSGTREIVERYVAALNSGDADRVAACVTEDFFNEHTSAHATSLRGREAYRQRLPEFFRVFRDLRYGIEDLLVEENRRVETTRATLRYRMTARFLSGGGVEHPVAIRGVFWFAVRQGRIAHRIDYWDGVEFERQTRG